MKEIILLSLLLAVSLQGISQKPESLEYQAVVLNDKGDVVVSGEVLVRISILKNRPTGTIVYSEIHEAKTDPSGIITLEIGKGKSNNGDFRSIDWDADSYFLKTETDTGDPAGFTGMVIMQLLKVPSQQTEISPPEKIIGTEEDELLIVRKFVGNFLDYRHTGPENYSGPNIIWIKTSMEKLYGKISAYGRSCDFEEGDNLYLKRYFYSPGGVTGYWIYQIENDSSVFYRVSEFQHDRKVLVETWF